MAPSKFSGRCRNGPWLGSNIVCETPWFVVPSKPKGGVYRLGTYNWQPSGWWWTR